MELKNILIIEDDSTLRDTVIEEFQTKGVEIQACEPDNLDALLDVPRKFQLVILDWLLYGDSSDLAKVCLKKIRQAYFVPVVVWTAELGVFENEVEDVIKIFPEACLHAKSKDEIGYQNLLDVLAKWHERTPARLSEQFRQSIATSVEAALYKLAEHSEDDLARGLKTLISMGDSSEVDMEHAVDVLLRLVSRTISGDADFIEAIHQTVVNLEYPPTSKKTRIESRIKKLHMYYEPEDEIVRTGDIVKINIDGNKKVNLCVVITPACDLARPRTPFLRLALINEKTTPGLSGIDKWPLPFLNEGENVLEVCFHEILVIKDQALCANTPANQQKPVMLYTHSYQTLSGMKVSITREKRLDEPYRADLLHCFASHASRIGLPEFASA